MLTAAAGSDLTGRIQRIELRRTEGGFAVISLELGPDEVETAICEWLRLRYRIDAPIERVVVKRNGGVDVMLSPTDQPAAPDLPVYRGDLNLGVV